MEPLLFFGDDLKKAVAADADIEVRSIRDEARHFR